MNRHNTKIIVSKFNENDEFTKKLDFDFLIYEKENPNSNYNITKNKGNEATAYLKYIIDHYELLTEYTIFIHCHEISWHHTGSIVDIIHSQTNKDHTFTNLNNYHLGDMEEDLDESASDLGIFFRTYIRPAVGSYKMYPNFTKSVLGCAQFIVHKNRILHHSKQFYQNIFDFLLNTEIDNFWSGRFLEWSWELIWNKCIQNIPIRIYLNDKIDIVDLNKGYCYIDNSIIKINNINYNVKDQYIYIKYL